MTFVCFRKNSVAPERSRMDMTKATLERQERRERQRQEMFEKEQIRSSQDFSTMPPPESPRVKRRNPSASSLLTDESLADRLPVPEYHLFSPSSYPEPHYQEMQDYPSVKSVTSCNLDLYAQSPGTPSDRPFLPTPQYSALPSPPSERTSLSSSTSSSSNHSPTVSVSLSSPSLALSSSSRRTSSGTPSSQVTRPRTVSSQVTSPSRPVGKGKVKTLVKIKQTHTVPSSSNVVKGPWRSTPEVPRDPFYPNVTVKSHPKTREMVYGKKCDVINIQLTPLIEPNEPDSADEPSPKKLKVERSQTTEIKTETGKVKRTFCSDCGKSLASLADIKNHPCNPEVECEDCLPKKTTLANKKVLMEHLKLIHPHRGEKFACHHCDKYFYHKTLVTLHIKAKHTPKEQEPSSEEVQEASLSSHDEPPAPEVEREITEDTATADPPTETTEAAHDNNSKNRYTIDNSFEEDIDAPASVPVETEKEKPYRCSRCNKAFNTGLRYQNHRRRCTGEGGGNNNVKISVNPRYVAGQFGWNELLQPKARCAKCGRSNYRQETLVKHLPSCKGTLMDNQGKKFECFYCTNPKRIFNTENSMRRHVASTHSKEAVEDGWDYASIPIKSVGLAANHLFR